MSVNRNGVMSHPGALTAAEAADKRGRGCTGRRSVMTGHRHRKRTSSSAGSTAKSGWRIGNLKPSARGDPMPLAYNSGRKEETPIWISE